jgi:hypothetical protein
MGEAGIEYGLCIYRGGRGFRALVGMFNEIDHDDLLPVLDSISLTFDHSDFLEPKDLGVIKELGIGSRYKSSQKWPRFRSYLPARYPWFLNADEATFLKAGIDQSFEVVRILEHDGMAFVKGSPDRFLVRAQRKTADGVEWFNDYRAPEAFVAPPSKKLDIGRSTIQTIRARPIKQEMIIEADLFITNTPICDSEPPWLPWVMLAVDVKSDHVFPPDHIMKDVDPVEEGTRQLISILKGLNNRPATIRIRSASWREYLQPYCADLGICLEQMASLPAIKPVKESMSEFMRWDKDILDPS